MILGTHNTFTYREPKTLLQKAIAFGAKCQRFDYKTQHEKYGVGCFDIRLFWDEKNQLEFRHGGVAYDGSDLDEILQYCEDNHIICRILFEERNSPKSLKKRSEKMNLKQKFIYTCVMIEKKYPNLECFCGRNCGTWEQLYKFKAEDKYKCIELYSSVTSLFKSNNKFLRVIDDVCPLIYAKRMNKENIAKFKKMYDTEDDNHILLVDFIDIQ